MGGTVIVSGARTPIGKLSGALASKTAGTECAIEVGTSLDAWPQVYVVGTAPEAVVSAGLTDGFETVTLTLPREPDAAKFARLRVTIAP